MFFFFFRTSECGGGSGRHVEKTKCDFNFAHFVRRGNVETGGNREVGRVRIREKKPSAVDRKHGFLLFLATVRAPRRPRPRRFAYVSRHLAAYLRKRSDIAFRARPTFRAIKQSAVTAIRVFGTSVCPYGVTTVFPVHSRRATRSPPPGVRYASVVCRPPCRVRAFVCRRSFIRRRLFALAVVHRVKARRR